jgi:hypothetical protein
MDENVMSTPLLLTKVEQYKISDEYVGLVISDWIWPMAQVAILYLNTACYCGRGN